MCYEKPTTVILFKSTRGEQGASISCWWMSFKENEGEEGGKRGEKIADLSEIDR